ncbi:hypothetical protein OG194_22110 [Streptomyces sp. NBC_01288]|uniref:hypothetical protein n=1 Tax=Streptomyces sp. NBC_01288 TaxID=2903814 RepID=UPI002E10B022|nr:hypothetical protein OG194_22110 [Streptomyces sp. NBC_01288]
MTTTDTCRPTSPNAAHTLRARPETDRTTTADPHQPTSPNAVHTLTDRPGVIA